MASASSSPRNGIKDAIKLKLEGEILEREREVLSRTSQMIKEHRGEAGAMSRNHPADASFAPDYTAGHSDQLRQQIFLLEQAIERVDAGTYGICVDCGEPIVLKRLDSVPWATQCTPCLSEKENQLRKNRRKSFDPTRQHYALVAV